MLNTFQLIRRIMSSESEEPTVSKEEYLTKFLHTIYPCKVPFTLVVLHTKPKTRMGSYRPRTRRIIINDKWGDIEQSKETAIHEYAHHIHYTEKQKTQRKEDPHGRQFWQIYGQLMYLAKQKGLYSHFDAL